MPFDRQSIRALRRVSLLLPFACLLGAAPAAQAQTSPNYAGEYVMLGKGFGEGDSEYHGSCTLKAATHGYDVSCYNRDTRHTYTGRGLAQGDTLSVFIGDLVQGDHRGFFIGEYLVVYKRDAQGNLSGTWLDAGGPGAGRETLTRKPAAR